MHDDGLASPDQIKAALPVTYVLHHGGYEPADQRGGDILYPTPWRPDQNPSLACYASDDSDIPDRWRDLARSEGGDVFDLIGRLAGDRAGDFGGQLRIARRLLEQMEDSGWAAPALPARPNRLDIEAYRAELQEHYLLQEDHGVPWGLQRWLDERTDYVSRIPATWLAENFDVVWADDVLHIPYLDEGGTVVTGKYRRPGEKTMSLPGSRGTYTVLYGEHLDTDPGRPVVLCEGETDVWSGTHATQEFCFLGLPSGAGTRPEKLASRLAGRRVLLGFDGDPAGREAIRTWSAALIELGSEVLIVPMPDGLDLSEVGDIPGLLAQAEGHKPDLGGLAEVGGQYLRLTQRGNGAPVSTFVVKPLRVLRSPDGARSYEVEAGGRTLLLLAGDLLTAGAFNAWSSRYGVGVWSGNQADLGALRSRIETESVFLPVESAADVAGLYEGHIVWAAGSIGDRPVRYVPSSIDVPLDIRLDDEPWDTRMVHVLRELNDHAITDPILAWCAAAPFRSLLSQFPVLNVAGVSGSGKTTTVRTLVPALTGSNIFLTLTSSTPFAVEALVNASNAFPVVFDEYRPGGRSHTLERLEQLARDAYDGQPSMKSKGGDRWNEMATIRTHAPIVIAGEQSITETSHAERMVLVHVRRPSVRDDKHARALAALTRFGTGGLARAFMRYVVATVRDDPNLVLTPVGPASLPDRVRYNLGVLDLGWRILNDFLSAHGGDPLEDPDWSGVVDTIQQAASEDPTTDALRWAVGDEYASRNVWVTDDGILCVSVPGFVADVRKAGVFTLPGWNTATIRTLLVDKYDASRGRRRDSFGKPKDVWMMPADLVLHSEVD